MISNKHFEAEILAEEVKNFLRTCPQRGKLRALDWPFDADADKTGIRKRYYKELLDAYNLCRSYFRQLRQYRGTLKGIPELEKLVTETRDMLWREMQMMEVDHLSPIEKSMFGKNVADLQEAVGVRFGRKFQEPKRPASRLPEEPDHYLGI